MAMTRRERVEAAVHGRDVDRVPICFWHHFRPKGSPRRLANATADFFGRFDLDVFKIMPDIPYPFPRNSIREVGDWDLLAPLDPFEGNMGWFLETVPTLRDILGDDTPIIVTVFSPFTRAMQFAGIETIRAHVEEEPGQVHHGLSTIARNLGAFCKAAIDYGADGIFLAVQGGNDGLLSHERYVEFAKPYDFMVLEECRAGWLNVVHAHGERDLFIDDYLQYPMGALSWSDRITGLSLQEVRATKPGLCLMGGIHERGPIVTGDVAAAEAEIKDALAQTEGRGLILANGCSIPDDSDDAKLARWADLARRLGQRS